MLKKKSTEKAVSLTEGLDAFQRTFRGVLDAQEKNPEAFHFLVEEKVGNPVTIGARVIPADEWAAKQTSRASAAADDWLARVKKPRKLPTEAALAAAGKRKDRLNEAEKLNKWEKAMARVNVDEMYTTIDKVGAGGYRAGVEARSHKVSRVVRELQPMVAALAASIDALPQTTDGDREKRLLAARRGMIEIGKKRVGA